MNRLLWKAKTEREFRQLLAVVEDYWEVQFAASYALRDPLPQSPEE